jgi:hypothetical protein
MTDLPIYAPSEMAPGETREPEVNGQGRFKIKCPDGKARFYTRVTTYIKGLDDRSKLEQWKLRTVLQGLAVDYKERTDLSPSVVDILLDSPELWDDRDFLTDLVDRAFEAGDGYLKARLGTERHQLSYLFDTMADLPPLTETEEEWLRRYVALCRGAGLEWVHRERRVVVDSLKVTGTFDGYAWYTHGDGVRRRTVVDLKTKAGEGFSFGRGECAQQLALYVHPDAMLYKDDGSPTGVREPIPDDMSRETGLILHVPQDNEGEAALYEVDLTAGLHGVGLSTRVRSWRNYSRKTFVRRHIAT